MQADSTLQIARSAIYAAFPSFVVAANIGLAFICLLAIGVITGTAPSPLPGVRRFLGALLPWIVGFFLVVTNTMDAAIVLRILFLPPLVLLLIGLGIGVGAVELWRLLAWEDNNLVLTLMNALISSLLLASLAFLLYPTHQATARLILPVYIGLVADLVFRGSPSNTRRPRSPRA